MSKSFADQKVVVIGGSSGMGREAAADVVAGGGSAVVVGRNETKVGDTVRALSETGKAWGIVADLADRDQVASVQEQLAESHADANLLVNSAGFFVPKPFLDQDGADYDAYLELNRATFPPQSWLRTESPPPWIVWQVSTPATSASAPVCAASPVSARGRRPKPPSGPTAIRIR
jgi:NAD(P)-dependent dehydrogenase (short-subunit alcohol dehydrogenase family)